VIDWMMKRPAVTRLQHAIATTGRGGQIGGHGRRQWRRHDKNIILENGQGTCSMDEKNGMYQSYTASETRAASVRHCGKGTSMATGPDMTA